MDKKHKNRFSIVFNEFDDRQLLAMEKLNSLPPRKIAVYIAEAISKYEKRGKSVSATITTEKRGRGRPRKALNPDGVSGEEPVLPAKTSSSHIQTESSEPNKPKDLIEKRENTSIGMVDNEMLDSMMSILNT